jgi:uncharacterized protein YqgC (DUF456 family)
MEIINLSGWESVGSGMALLVAGFLMLVGLLGCVVPVLPGHVIILLAAVGYRLMLGREESGLAWWSFLILALFMAVSQLIETFSGAAGSKWFGGTKWGAFGALLGGLGGMFLMPFGLIIGPLIGAVLGELLFARLHPKSAFSSGIGSVFGTLAGMAVKLMVGVLMVAWILVDVFYFR